MESSIQDVIAAAQQQVDERARCTTIHDPMQWSVRRAYLDELKTTVSERQELRTVFVSYSSGGVYVFRQISALLTAAGLSVNTGFKTTPGAMTVVETIIQQMECSSIYIGILTPDIEIHPARSKAVYAPGVWTLEERGMAMALRKPLILMVHERVQPDFWKSVAAQQLYRFTKRNYRGIGGKVCDAVVELRRRLAETGP